MADTAHYNWPIVAATDMADTEFTPKVADFQVAVDAAIYGLNTGKQAAAATLTSWTAVSRAAGFDAFAATPTSANLQALLTDESGAGGLVFAGGALGTPSSAVLTNATGLPISTGVAGLGAGIAAFLATPTSANLRAAITDESGAGGLLFADGALGTPASGVLTNCTGLPIATGISGLGANWATFLGNAKPTTISGYGITDGVTTARTVSTAGLATGGGDLSANRTVTVTAATAAEVRAQTSTSVALTPASLAQKAAFSAYKNGVSQNGIGSITFTKLAFGTEFYDIGSCFDTTNSRWTPPAGRVIIGARMSVNTAGAFLSGTGAGGGIILISIFKNGGEWRRAGGPTINNTDNAAMIVEEDDANGTDYYEIYVYFIISSGTAAMNTGAAETRFWGSQV